MWQYLQSEISEMTDEMEDRNEGMPELDDISQLGKKVKKKKTNAYSRKVHVRKVLMWPGLDPSDR